MAQKDKNQRYYNLLVGTYTSGSSEGIYVYQFDTETGDFKHKYTASDIENPSFLVVSDDKSNVYAVNELSGEKPGAVSAYKFDPKTGALEFINKQPSGGGDPCYLTLDERNLHLIVGNYTGGNLSVVPVLSAGSLGTPVQTIQHKGESVNKARQESAHVHSTVFSPDGKFLFVGDLGTDKVNIYKFRKKNVNNPLAEGKTPFASVEAGAGPRHLIFDRKGNYAYLVLELTAEVAVFKHNEGDLTHVQTVPMTSEDFEGEVGAAEIKISPDGKFLYASNRGDANEIAIYEVNSSDGKLSLAGIQSLPGKTPRNFMIDPTGKFLLVALQGSDSIIVYKRNPETGLLTITDKSIEVGTPVYLTMVPEG